MKTYRVKRTLVVAQDVKANSEKEALEATECTVVKGKNLPGVYLVEETYYEVNEVKNGQG